MNWFGLPGTIVVPNNLPFEDWDLHFLINYILNIHHAYIFQTTTVLRQELSAFTVGHARKLPEINKVAEAFDKLSSLLLIHSKHEEEIIFPYIRQMADAYKRKEAYGSLVCPYASQKKKPLNNILHSVEHVEIDKLVKQTEGSHERI